jgi:hypothetical protein
MALTKITGNVLENNLEIPSVSSINDGPLAGFRNAIINGNFDIWQRGTSFAGQEYTADRWITERAGSTCTTSRQSFALGQTDVPGEPTYFCRFVVSSVTGADNSVVPNQRIEGVRTFAGQTVTLSFWAKADATKFMSIEFSQNFGTGGTPSTRIIEIGVQKFTLTTSWQKFTKTITLPSIAGKTLGTNNNDVLQIYFWLDAGSNSNSRTNSLGHQSGTFDIAQVQVETGPVATPFERRPIGTELALCQRYYQQSTGTNSMKRVWNNTGITAAMQVSVDFPVYMRTAPNLTVYGDVSDGSQLLMNSTTISNTSGFTQYHNIANGQFLDMHYYIASSEL